MRRKGISFVFLFLLICYFPIYANYADTPAIPKLSFPPPAHKFVAPLRPTFRWEAVEGARKYHIQIADFDFEAIGTFDWSRCIVNDMEVRGTSYRISSELSTGKYYWRVRAYKDHWKPWSWTQSFEVIPYPKIEDADYCVFTRPSNGSVVYPPRQEFMWCFSALDYYPASYFYFKFQLSNDESFRNILFEDIINICAHVSGGSITLAKITPPIDLDPGQTYYWRVRLEDSDSPTRMRELGIVLPGEWSDVRSFTTAPSPPARVFLITPAHGECVSGSVTFGWNEVPTAEEYEVVISQSEDFSTTILRLFPTINSATISFRQPNGTYFWRVRARNAYGWGEWSCPWIFVKSRCPAPPLQESQDAEQEEGSATIFRPELYGPEGEINTNKPQFSWRGWVRDVSFNPWYHLQVSYSPDFSYCFIDQELLHHESYNDIFDCISYTPPTALPSDYVHFYWRVRAKMSRAYGWGPWSEVKCFWMKITPLRLIAPQNNTILRLRKPIFSWIGDARIGEFEIEVSDRRDFYTSCFRIVTNSSTENLPYELSDGEYFWRVREKVGGSWGPWSEPWSFKIDLTPPEIRILSPSQRSIRSEIPATVVVSCEVTDNLSGVKKVEYLLNGKIVAHRTRPHHDSTYIAGVDGLKEGLNSITIRAYDKAGVIGNISTTYFTLQVERSLFKKPEVKKFQKLRKGLKELKIRTPSDTRERRKR